MTANFAADTFKYIKLMASYFDSNFIENCSQGSIDNETSWFS